MFKIGYKQTAYVNRISEYGVYLSDTLNGDQEIKLDSKERISNAKLDMSVEVFVFRNLEGEVTATLKKPKLCLYDIGMMKVVGKVKSGYFLESGLDKDYFMPQSEAKNALNIGDEVLVRISLDDDQQLMASMKIYERLEVMTSAKVNQMVKGYVYEIKPEMGAFVAIENRYFGLIPVRELYPEIKVGSEISARVTLVREDGKLNLSVRQKTAVQIHDDVDIIMAALESKNGVLPFGDESDPEEIKKVFNMSKKAFKRAIGKLYKDGKISLQKQQIKKI